MIVGTTEAESWRCRFPSRQTFQEAAAILKISTARLRVLLMSGRVQGAYKSGKMWLMPLVNGQPIIKQGKRGPAPRWRNPKTPAQTIIHVNSHIIKENHKNKKKLQKPLPVITVKKQCQLSQSTHSVLKAMLPSTEVELPTEAQPADLNEGEKQGVQILLSNNGITVSSGLEQLEQTDNKTRSALVNLYGHEVEILGGCRVVYNPDHPKYGAKVWIETLYDVIVTR